MAQAGADSLRRTGQTRGIPAREPALAHAVGHTVGYRQGAWQQSNPQITTRESHSSLGEEPS